MTLLQDLFIESGLDPDEMLDVVDALAPLADPVDEVPAPSAELAALFAAAPADGRAGRALGQRTSAVAGVLVLAFSSVGATGLSAAANTLPGPLQHQVSQFSRHFLPFDLPEPPGHREPAPLSSTPAPEGAGLPRDVEEASRSQAHRREALVGEGRGPATGEQGRPPGASKTGAHPRHDSDHVADPGAQPSSAPAAHPTATDRPGGAPSDQGAAAGQPGDGTSAGAGKPASAGKDQGKDKDKGQDTGQAEDSQVVAADAPSSEGPGSGKSQGPDAGNGNGSANGGGSGKAQGNGGGPGPSQGGDTKGEPNLPAVPLPALPPAPGGIPVAGD